VSFASPCYVDTSNEKTHLLASVDTQKSLELEGEQIANTGLHLAQVVGISIGTLSPSTIPICFMFLWVEWETIDTNV